MVTLESPNWSDLPVQILLLEMPNPQVRSTLPPSGYLPPKDHLDLRYHRMLMELRAAFLPPQLTAAWLAYTSK